MCLTRWSYQRCLTWLEFWSLVCIKHLQLFQHQKFCLTQIQIKTFLKQKILFCWMTDKQFPNNPLVLFLRAGQQFPRSTNFSLSPLPHTPLKLCILSWPACSAPITGPLLPVCAPAVPWLTIPSCSPGQHRLSSSSLPQQLYLNLKHLTKPTACMFHVPTAHQWCLSRTRNSLKQNQYPYLDQEPRSESVSHIS